MAEILLKEGAEAATPATGYVTIYAKADGLPYTKDPAGTERSLLGNGTVVSVAVATANGFAGTVANPTTTPSLTLKTSVTGLLEGNGTSVSAAATTGSGSVVKATSPTLVTPVLGTPSSGTLTNCTGLPAAGVSGTALVASAIGTSVQAYDADLATIAGLTATTNNFIQAKSSAWASRTPTQVTADLINFVGDSGAGGTKGLVPAPAAGDAAKYLKGDGTWTTVTGSGAVATDAIWDAKGDLAVATAADTAVRLAVGTNGYALVADSAEATGVKWTAIAGSASQAFTASGYTAGGTGTIFSYSGTNSTSLSLFSVAGAMTYDTATINANGFSPTITGGASTTTIRNLVLSPSFTPTATTVTTLTNTFIQGILNSSSNVTNFFGNQITVGLGEFATGGTVATVYGNYVVSLFNASATTDITTWHSYYAANVVDGSGTTVSNAYSYTGIMSAGTNRRNLYMSGTALNYLNGALMIGSNTDDGSNKLQVTGAIKATSNILGGSGGGVVGYAVGAGGDVTQATSKSTNVTLNKACGTITMNGAALGAGTIVSFVLNSSALMAESMVVCNHELTGTLGAYTITTGVVSAGTCTIYVRNNTAGSLSEAIKLRFAAYYAPTS
jgi:hypothetical protein